MQLFFCVTQFAKPQEYCSNEQLLLRICQFLAILYAGLRIASSPAGFGLRVIQGRKLPKS
jgi:hypothetical protein